MRMRSPFALAVAALCAVGGACAVEVNVPGFAPGPGDPPVEPPAPVGLEVDRGLGPQVARRLTRAELGAVVASLLGPVPQGDLDLLPEDAFAVEDDYTHHVFAFDDLADAQVPSEAFLLGLQELATRAAARLLADEEARDRVIPCAPAGPDDAACLAAFVDAFAPRALRRGLADDERAAFLALGAQAVAADDFYVGPALVVRALLLHPELLYRIETGVAVAGRDDVVRLTGVELASRLSFFLWGQGPDDVLLARALAGDLETVDDVREEAERMMALPAARAQVRRFHALWLGYDRPRLPGTLAAPMRREADALVDRVVFDEQLPWSAVFTLPETFVDAALATHYGLPAPADDAGAWVSTAGTGRAGLLGQGSFLSAAAKPGDTSPTLRGKHVRNQLFCEAIPPAPPEVNTDEPPVGAPGDCKVDRYAVHAAAGCASCHNAMDPIGFGLERFDNTGAYREADVDNASCAIEGVGDVDGSAFAGPAGLGALLQETGTFNRCGLVQLLRFSLGRFETDDDAPLLAQLQDRFLASDERLDRLLVDIASSEAFLFRVLPDERGEP